eukprot:scpid96163/ scgid9134/ 
MEWLEGQLLATCGERIKAWLRYVDDTFTIIKKGELPHVLAAANAISPHIPFTVEEEKNGGVAFLDVWVQRSETNLSTQVYRKPTHTGKYINVASHHPNVTKCATLSCLAQRIESHCSTNLLKAKEQETLGTEFLSNGYPLETIEGVIQQVHRRHRQHQQQQDRQQQPQQQQRRVRQWQ